MTASISGVLVEYVLPDSPPWAPHRTVTHAQALYALERHLKRDCVSTGDIFHSGRISGNFFLASAGFCIEEATVEDYARARAMMKAYANSEHCAIYKELTALYRSRTEAADRAMQKALDDHLPSHERYAAADTARAAFRGRVAPLEQQLESIYRVGGMSGANHRPAPQPQPA